eukprot:Pgem_evm1s12935
MKEPTRHTINLGWLDEPSNSFTWKGKFYNLQNLIMDGGGGAPDAIGTGAVVLHEFGHAYNGENYWK